MRPDALLQQNRIYERMHSKNQRAEITKTYELNPSFHTERMHKLALQST